jgi:hypothetical protein
MQGLTYFCGGCIQVSEGTYESTNSSGASGGKVGGGGSGSVDACDGADSIAGGDGQLDGGGRRELVEFALDGRRRHQSADHQ